MSPKKLASQVFGLIRLESTLGVPHAKDIRLTPLERT